MQNLNVQTAIKTALVNNETFTILPTYAEMDDKVLMHLADQMLRELGGSRCVNSEIEFILKHADDDYEFAPFCRDDITNGSPTGYFTTLEGEEVELTEEEKETLIEEIQEKLEEFEEESYNTEKEKLEALLDNTQDIECENYPEIMQWFALDERLIYRLEEAGQCTLVGEYWGRQAYGQSITMDHVMKKVCYDLAMCWSK